MYAFATNARQIADSLASRKHKDAAKKDSAALVNKNGLVLVLACWEAYLEELAEAAFAFMIARAPEPGAIPVNVRALATRSLEGSRDTLREWALAGDGWKKVLERHKNAVVGELSGFMNIPSAGRADRLFKDLLGLERLSASWRWPGQSSMRSAKKLNELLKLRRTIARRVADSKTVDTGYVTNCTSFLTRLAIRSHNSVNRHVKSITTYYPWVAYQFKGKS